ncbi:hypothetical protein HPB48_013928 [Haemaphysalis longicornis]|uniref:Uncharacterized protein n=1 Tax=Haemaphysalis longicornis TaxID=44386 RepID=A0A9J6GSM3_HAELO|nr:hypothetical protein HPB48_013928 [Haemaphysalis longicornis]
MIVEPPNSPAVGYCRPVTTTLAIPAVRVCMASLVPRKNRLSMQSSSVEKRFSIRPRGVQSKKDTGLNSTHRTIELCRRLDRFRKATAKTKDPSQPKSTVKDEVIKI